MSHRPISRAAYVRAHSKSVSLAAVLSVLFGPVGALYGSPSGAVILILITLFTGLLALAFTWPLAVVVAVIGASNSRAKARATYDLVAPPA